MTTGVEQVSFLGMMLSLVLIGVTLVLMRLVRVQLTRDILIATARTFAQLVAIGFILEGIFSADRWYWVLGFLAVMISVATHTAWLRVKHIKHPGVIKAIGWSITLGSGLTILWVNNVVLRVEPWYHPQFLIPFAGMIIGNSMNSAAIALDRFYAELYQCREEIETLLSLGASVDRSVEKPLCVAITAAMIPNINAMMIVGIVSLPGTMTGQILAGQSPLTSISYQIVVMLMLTCAAAITAVVVTQRVARMAFNAADQLIVSA